jgi:alpha-L-fucosidase 2
MRAIRRRTFLAGVAAGAGGAAVRVGGGTAPAPVPTGGRSSFDPFARAAGHPIVRRGPAVSFFEGALLGNGGLGVVVTTRPDAVVLHFGHNDVWDIRVAEDHADEIGTFREVFERVKAIPSSLRTLDEDPWYREYCRKMAENYGKPYPRPFPCGSLVLGFDRRRAELMGHRLDVSTGLCTVELRVGKETVRVEIFVDAAQDRVWLRLVDERRAPRGGVFGRVRVLPDPKTPAEMPGYVALDAAASRALGFSQVLPFLEPGRYDQEKGHPRDRAFRLAARTSGPLVERSRVGWSGAVETMGPLERALDETPLLVCAQLEAGLASDLGPGSGTLPEATAPAFEAAARSSREVWQAYWGRSGVALDHPVLERTWYHNLYFLNCAVRPGTTCPGLFANWSYGDIGTAWHGDYHMNYNTQQPFWVTFSSNHVDKHLPYVDLVDRLLPISRKWAREYYGLRGAYFPHSAYPVEMSIMPYPVPTWGWEICETPWTVQSLWWHYLYTADPAFLERRAFGPLREAVLFLVDYMRRPEAHGPQWKDDRYHVFPTVAPELYGLRPGFAGNHDCIVDLTLIRFVLRAYLRSLEVLGRRDEEHELAGQVRDVLEHFPEYPTASSPQGTVFVAVPGEDPETVYNTPDSTMTVFPGEHHGLGSLATELEIARNSWRQQRNEGGNDLVFLNLQGARLGLLDLDRFARQIEYSLMPNGTCTDMCLQVHGRYDDTTPFDFMARMGVWFENFALPVVVNECLLQSYDGTLRLFPNWPAGRAGEFRTLRAVGGFLVSAATASGAVQWVEVTSEAGGSLAIELPWRSGAVCRRASGPTGLAPGVARLETTAGETLVLVRRS